MPKMSPFLTFRGPNTPNRPFHAAPGLLWLFRMRYCLAAFAAALLVALAIVRYAGRNEQAPSTGPAQASSPTSSEAPARDSQADPRVAGAAADSSTAGRFRLLEGAEASARNAARVRHPWAAYLRMSDEVMRTWSGTCIDLNFCDAPLQEVIAWLTQRYGLIARLDPEVATRNITVTFRVCELGADHALDLMLRMADLRWTIGSDGELWITAREGVSACEPPFVKDLGQASRDCAQARGAAEPRVEAPDDVAARSKVESARFDGSIVRQPLMFAMEELSGKAELRFEFTRSARDLVDGGAAGTVVGERMTLPAALGELLVPLGLGWRIRHGRILVETKEEQAEEAEAERVAAEVEATNRLETARLRARVVKLAGDALAVEDVARQAGGQLGIPVFVDPRLLDCDALWSADGGARTMGEVLDALAAGAPLTWSWQPLYEFEDDKVVDRGWRLWLFSVKSR